MAKMRLSATTLSALWLLVHDGWSLERDSSKLSFVLSKQGQGRRTMHGHTGNKLVREKLVKKVPSSDRWVASLKGKNELELHNVDIAG